MTSILPAKEVLEEYRRAISTHPELLQDLKVIELSYLKEHASNLISRAADLYMTNVYYARLNSTHEDTVLNSNPDNQKELNHEQVCEVKIGFSDKQAASDAHLAFTNFIENNAFCRYNKMVISAIEAELDRRTPKTVPTNSSNNKPEPPYPITLPDLITDVTCREFVRDALRRLQIADTNDHYQLGQRERSKLLAFVHALRDNSVIRNGSDYNLLKPFFHYFSIQEQKLDTRSDTYQKAYNNYRAFVKRNYPGITES